MYSEIFSNQGLILFNLACNTFVESHFIMLHAGQTIFYDFYRAEAKGQGHSDVEIKFGTSQPQDVSTNKILDSYFQCYSRYASDRIFLELWPGEVKVTVTQKQYTTLRSQDVSTCQIWDNYLK